MFNNKLYEKLGELINASSSLLNKKEEIENKYNQLRNTIINNHRETIYQYEGKIRQQKQNNINEINKKRLDLTSKTNELENLEKKLCEYDKSYEKRKIGEFTILNPGVLVDYDAVKDPYMKFNEIYEEIIVTVRNCLSTSKGSAFQEIEMLFSNKRKALYEKIYLLFLESKELKNLAENQFDNQIVEMNDIDSIYDNEIQQSSDEMNALTIDVNENERKELEAIEKVYLSYCEEILSLNEIELIQQLSNYLGNNICLPNECTKQIEVGKFKLKADKNEFSDYGMYIEQNYFSLPALFELDKMFNFVFMHTNEEDIAKKAIHSIMYTMLKNQPASRQQFILSDPEENGKGFDTFLEMLNQYPNVMGDYILTTKESIKKKLVELNDVIRNSNQTQLVGYENIFDYNEKVVEHQESLKCLCLLDFPKYFDEELLELLYKIIHNGNRCGVNVLIDFNKDFIHSRMNDSCFDMITDILMESHLLEYVDNEWKFENGVSLELYDHPSINKMHSFLEDYTIQYKDITNTKLSFSKIMPDKWFDKESSSELSIPIGKNENGEIQNITLGKGTSHYALVAGSTGSGKSTMLHTLIMSALINYNPEELNIYLLDFKSGVEFKVFSQRKIPHIKVLALDAMQEFGLGVLENLWEEMNRRSALFNEQIKLGLNIKDINDYRQLTGRKLPRILVIADEFQMLFNEDENRRIANKCGSIFANMVSLARVYGIHFIFATQTLSRLNGNFSISKSTMNEMHIRIGLKCIESECDALFGDSKGKKAFSKMNDEVGSAVYCHDYVFKDPVGMKVAKCDENEQEVLLSQIETYYSSYESETSIFVADDIPSVKDCKEFYENDTDIYLGEPIYIGKPVALKMNQKKSNNLLIVGSDASMMDRIVALLMLNMARNQKQKNIYLIDGYYLMEEDYLENLNEIMRYKGHLIDRASDNESIFKIIDELYDAFERRRQKRMNGIKIEDLNKYLIIHNLQWIETINRILQNKDISEYLGESEEIETSSDVLSQMDALMASLNEVKKKDKKVSYTDKLQTLIENGYTYGIHIVITAQDYLSIKEYRYGFMPKFRNKIIFGLSNSDAENLIPEAKCEKLKNNIVIYHDGIKPALLFKPYAGIKEAVRKERE